MDTHLLVVTVEEVLNSPMICDPLTKLSCCPNADGAAAVVLCDAEISKQYTSRPIRVAASVHDCFTISEIAEYEGLGFCQEGEGGQYIQEGKSDFGGQIPANIDGGLISNPNRV